LLCKVYLSKKVIEKRNPDLDKKCKTFETKTKIIFKTKNVDKKS